MEISKAAGAVTRILAIPFYGHVCPFPLPSPSHLVLPVAGATTGPSLAQVPTTTTPPLLIPPQKNKIFKIKPRVENLNIHILNPGGF